MNNDRCKVLLELAPFGYSYNEIIVDDNGKPVDYKLLDVNAEYKKLSGLQSVDVINKHATELFPALLNEDPGWIDLYGEVALNESQKSFEKFFKPLNAWYKVKAFSPQKYYFVTFITDITKNKKSETTLKDVADKYSELINAMNDTVWVISFDGDFIDVSKSAERILGYSRDELLKMGPADIDNSIPVDKIKELAKNMSADKTQVFETTHKTKPGKVIPVEISSSLVNYMGQRAILSIARDITDRKKAEEYRKESEERYRSLFEQTHDAVFIMDMQGNYVNMNKGAVNMLGYKSEQDIIGLSFKDISVEPNKSNSILQKLSSGEKLPIYERKLYKKNGDVIDVEINVQIVTDRNDKPLYIQSVARDISNRKMTEEALQKSEQYLKSVLKSQKEMICRYKPDTTITFVNDAFCKFFGKSPQELIEEKWINLVDENKKNFLKKHLQKLLNNPRQTFFYEHEKIMPDGKTRWFEWSDYAIKNEKDDELEFQGVGYDITDRKERERLEKEIELTRNTLQFKQNFLASMSHEIRTPLTGIMGVAELLDLTTLNTEQKDYVNTLKQASENLREIIDQVLDYSKIEAGKVKLKTKKININNLIYKTSNFFEGICRKPINFVTNLDKNLPVIIEADEKRILQVINNLLINAVRFTEKGKIGLNIRKEKLINNKEIIIKIEVCDTGIGIKPERQKTIFSPFSQVHEIETQNYKGIGLGLAICKEIVELHEGEMGLFSVPGEGTTVWFNFKALIPDARASLEKEQKSKKHFIPEKLNVLFVEDKDVIQKIVKLQLNNMGYDVELANNGEKALKTFKPGKFDLILMDIQMPVMDGITATKILKDKYKEVPPIVGLSANAFEGDREKYMQQGMDEYLTKPLKSEDFIELLIKFFDQK